MDQDLRHLEILTKAELIAEVQRLRACHRLTVEQNPSSQSDFSDANKVDRYENLETEFNELIDAVDSMNAAFILYDANNRFVRCNSLHKIYYPHLSDVYLPGTPRSVALRRHAEHLADLAPEFDIEAYLAKRDIYRGIPRPDEERQMTNGRWLSIREHLTSTGGLVTVRTDITDRKKSEAKQHESEERFRASFKSSHGIATITDIETGTFIDVNDAWLTLRGFEKHEVIGKTAVELNVWGSEERREEIVSELKLRGRLLNYETHAVTKAGEIRETIINAEVVNIQGKELMFLSGSDVTERNRFEKQLRRSQKMEAVGQLTGGIAHDFNNILGIVLGNLEIIQSLPPGDNKIAGRIDVARKAVERGADITHKLLGFSRKDPHEVRLVDINGSVNNLLDLVSKSLTVSIDIKTYLADELWTVEIDPGDFEDAILNLALNARDAMPDGGKLTIETANIVFDEEFVVHNPKASAESYAQITIRDTGAGMTNKVIDRVFDPFFTTKEVGKGTGLGLSMVYGFVERSGGFITIDSEIGKGSAFHLFIPRTIENATDLNDTKITTGKLPLGHEKILIVDDEEGLRDIVAINLGDLGYNTLVAGDGPSALKILEQERDIDLLFSDVVMPKFMNAYELAQKAHKRHPQLKILLTSGYDENLGEIENDDPFLIKLRKTQLKKPYAISELAIAIREALDEEL
ncbi:hypothetical protein A9Q83_09600 [Alphaproteobacteria bacterium 46_93_T64]|nr:hypothetical protein A9Q83_09600 [Alphaproteobacteria bacterium 46_93_T64]